MLICTYKMGARSSTCKFCPRTDHQTHEHQCSACKAVGQHSWKSCPIKEEPNERTRIITAADRLVTSGIVTDISELRHGVGDESISYEVGHSELTPENGFKVVNYYIITINHYAVPMTHIKWDHGIDEEYYYLGKLHPTSPKVGDRVHLTVDLSQLVSLPELNDQTHIAIDTLSVGCWSCWLDGELDPLSESEETNSGRNWLEKCVYLIPKR